MPHAAKHKKQTAAKTVGSPYTQTIKQLTAEIEETTHHHWSFIITQNIVQNGYYFNASFSDWGRDQI